MNFHTPATYKLSGRFGFWGKDAGLQPARHTMTPGFLPVGRRRVGFLVILRYVGKEGWYGEFRGWGPAYGKHPTAPVHYKMVNIDHTGA